MVYFIYFLSFIVYDIFFKGIVLKNNVVIIDEAHNLLEAVVQMYSAEVSYKELFCSYEQLNSYKNKFNTRFSFQTLLNLNKLISIIKKLFMYLGKSNKVFNESNLIIHI